MNGPRVPTAGTYVRPDPVHWSRVANVMRRRAKRAKREEEMRLWATESVRESNP